MQRAAAVALPLPVGAHICTAGRQTGRSGGRLRGHILHWMDDAAAQRHTWVMPQHIRAHKRVPLGQPAGKGGSTHACIACMR